MSLLTPRLLAFDDYTAILVESVLAYSNGIELRICVRYSESGLGLNAHVDLNLGVRNFDHDDLVLQNPSLISSSADEYSAELNYWVYLPENIKSRLQIDFSLRSSGLIGDLIIDGPTMTSARESVKILWR